MDHSLVPLNIDRAAKRIVVINTAFLGDLVLTIPFLIVLRRKFPQSKIDLICKKGIGDFFIKLKLVDEIHEVQKGSAGDYNQVADKVNQQVTDYLFCIHRSFRSFLFSMKIKAVCRVGYKLNFNFLGYSKRVKRDLTLPEPMRILQMLCCIDGIFADFFTEETQYKDFNVKLNTQHMVDVPKWAAYPAIHLPGTNDVNEKLLQRLAKITSSPKRIAVFPGSVWNTKRWPVEYFAKLVQQLAEKNYTVLLMGGPGEEMYGEAIENKNGESEKVINLIGKSSVWESILVLNQCDLVIANDSASAHLAAMLNKKILVFFGPTVLSFGYRPWGNSVYVMENANLKCRPCGSHGHDKCPIGTHECMTSINAESALKKVESVLY